MRGQTVHTHKFGGGTADKLAVKSALGLRKRPATFYTGIAGIIHLQLDDLYAAYFTVMLRNIKADVVGEFAFVFAG